MSQQQEPMGPFPQMGTPTSFQQQQQFQRPNPNMPSGQMRAPQQYPFPQPQQTQTQQQQQQQQHAINMMRTQQQHAQRGGFPPVRMPQQQHIQQQQLLQSQNHMLPRQSSNPLPPSTQQMLQQQQRYQQMLHMQRMQQQQQQQNPQQFNNQQQPQSQQPHPQRFLLDLTKSGGQYQVVPQQDQQRDMRGARFPYQQHGQNPQFQNPMTPTTPNTPMTPHQQQYQLNNQMGPRQMDPQQSRQYQPNPNMTRGRKYRSQDVRNNERMNGMDPNRDPNQPNNMMPPQQQYQQQPQFQQPQYQQQQQQQQPTPQQQYDVNKEHRDPRLPTRNFWQIEQSKSHNHNHVLRLVSFNTLADVFAKMKTGMGRRRTPYRFLEWSYRAPLIIRELMQYQADVICLQEVDHYDYFEQLLSPVGYAGIYEQRKPTGFPTLYNAHGLAIFWRTDRLSMVGRECRVLGDPFCVNNIALLARLRRRDPATQNDFLEFDIWNTQLIEGVDYRSEKRRLKQVEWLFEAIQDVSHEELTEKHFGFRRNIDQNEEEVKGVVEAHETKERETPLDPFDEMRAKFHAKMEFALQKAAQQEYEALQAENEIREQMEAEPPATEIEPEPEPVILDSPDPTIEPIDITDHLQQTAEVDLPPREPKREPATTQENTEPATTTVEQKENSSPIVSKHTTLKRPVLVVGDFKCSPIYQQISQNEHVPPFTYTYLTAHSQQTSGNKSLVPILSSRELSDLVTKYHYEWYLESAYARGMNGEPQFTCWSGYSDDKDRVTDLNMTCDYVLYSKNMSSNTTTNGAPETENSTGLDAGGFQLMNLVELLTPSFITQNGARCLPCKDYPSDHVCLVVDLEYVGTPLKNTAN